MPDTNDISPEAAGILSGAPFPTQSNPQPPANEQQRADVAAQPAPQVNAPTQAPLSALAPEQGYAGKELPSPAPPNPVSARHRALGMLAEKIFSGGTTQYSVGPDGKIQKTFVKDTPGSVFRNLLGGALMGMAAGSGAHDFASGAGRGASAVMQSSNEQDKQRYERAQQAQTAQQQQQNIDEQRKYREAMIEKMNVENLRAEADLNLRTQEFIDNRNDRERELQGRLEEMGAQPLPILVGGKDINGKVGNGKDFMARVNQGGVDSVKGPAGTHTVLTNTVDTDGISLKGGKWVDESGNEVNLEDRTAHTLYAVPDDLWHQRSTIRKGSELLKLAPHLGQFIDPNAAINPTWGDVLSVVSKDATEANEQAEVDRKKALANRANAQAGVARGKGAAKSSDNEKAIRDQIRIAQGQLNAALKGPVPDDDGAKAAQEKLNGLFAQLDQLKTKPPLRQTTGHNANAVAPGFVRFRDSQGGVHDIPSKNLKAAQQRDPGLQVIQ